MTTVTIDPAKRHEAFERYHRPIVATTHLQKEGGLTRLDNLQAIAQSLTIDGKYTETQCFSV